MKVGITYDLRDDYLAQGYSLEETAEFDRLDTIEAVDNALKQAGFTTDRIGNVMSLVRRLAGGNRWALVFNIAEGMYGIGREALVPALLDAYRIPYTFSDPLILALTLHKGMTKSVLRDAGIPTALFDVVKTMSDVDELMLAYPLFAKPIGEGTGKGINEASLVNNKKELRTTCLCLLKEFGQPVLVEEFLPGREFTVGIVGTGDDSAVVGVMEILFKREKDSKIYSFVTKSDYQERIEYHVPDPDVRAKCVDLALASWKVLGCRDGGRIDIRMDKEGEPNFIEVNPLAGLNPIHSDLPILCRLNAISYQELIERIMNSALKRINNAKTADGYHSQSR